MTALPARPDGSQDISPIDSLRTERALRDSEARLALATSAAGLGIWDWDIRSGEIVYSARAKEILGLPPEAPPLTVEAARRLTHPDDLMRTSPMAQRALDPAIRERVPYEYRIVRPDGELRWLLAFGEAVFETVDGVERAVRYVGTLQDITNRRQTESALRDSESRLRLAIEAARIAVWEYDVANERVTLSPELKRLLGFAPDAEPSIEDVRAGYLPGTREAMRAAGRAALERGERFFEVEYRHRRHDDGDLRWMSMRAEIRSDAAGNPSRVIGVLMDITEQKRALERQRLLIDELNHRVKNTLATVQSIATQSLRHAETLAEARSSIVGRLFALSRAHDLLTEECWERARIGSVIDGAMSPQLVDGSRLDRSGPDIWLNARAALDLTMILQELVTNAMKYGALSNADGRVALQWRVEDADDSALLHLHWSETGGPSVKPPVRSGFGSRLIRTLAREQSGSESLVYAPEGLRCSVTFRLRKGPTGLGAGFL